MSTKGAEGARTSRKLKSVRHALLGDEWVVREVIMKLNRRGDSEQSKPKRAGRRRRLLVSAHLRCPLMSKRKRSSSARKYEGGASDIDSSAQVDQGKFGTSMGGWAKDGRSAAALKDNAAVSRRCPEVSFRSTTLGQLPSSVTFAPNVPIQLNNADEKKKVNWRTTGPIPNRTGLLHELIDSRQFSASIHTQGRKSASQKPGFHGLARA
ncbi:hypothetical protein FB451DRAFT_1178591 [Mycena latifolia]|nr:hypothetical protein FB451DRAFT_1178591 [Mycena latifolia]